MWFNLMLKRAHSCSIHLVNAELTMHSGALSENGKLDLSNLGGGLCQAGTTYWTLGSMHFLLLVQFRPLSCASPNTDIMWQNIRNICYLWLIRILHHWPPHENPIDREWLRIRIRIPLLILQTWIFVCHSSLRTV